MDDASPLRPGRSLPDLVAELSNDLASLVRKESELVRVEVGEKVNAAAKAVVDIAAGGLLLIAALLVLLEALVLALGKLIGPIWSALAVGVVVAVVGYFLVRTGMKAISPSGLALRRSTEQLRKDAEFIKGTGK